MTGPMSNGNEGPPEGEPEWDNHFEDFSPELNPNAPPTEDFNYDPASLGGDAAPGPEMPLGGSLGYGISATGGPPPPEPPMGGPDDGHDGPMDFNPENFNPDDLSPEDRA